MMLKDMLVPVLPQSKGKDPNQQFINCTYLKTSVFLLLCVRGVETVEIEVIGGRSTCWCSHRSNWVAHNVCEARSTLNSGTSPTGCHNWQIWGYRWVYGGV